VDGGTAGITDAATVLSHLDELAAGRPVCEEEWCTSDSWRWHDTIRELRRKTDSAHKTTRSDEPTL
jgi:hypothetical protein